MQSHSQEEILQDKLFKMVEKNDLEGVRNAIQKNPELVNSKRFNESLLHEACWNDLTQMVELLISLRADVNAKKYDGSPPIADAIYKNASLKTIQVLLDNKADLNYGGPYSGPLYWANVNCGQDVVEALLNAGARHHANEVFASAVMHGKEKFVDMLLENHFPVYGRDSEGRPLLMWVGCNSSDERHYRIAKKLLDHKADVNAKDKNGETPLYWAISNKLIDLSQLFLAYGAKLDTTDIRGVTPLLYAAEQGDISTIKLLATKATPSDINHKDYQGNTALHYAAQNSDIEVCQYFIDKGLDVNAQNKSGMTPLHYACAYGKYKNIEILLKAGAETALRDTSGKTPLDKLRSHPNHDDPAYEACVKRLEQLEILETSKQLEQSSPLCKPIVQKEIKVPVSSVRLTSGSFTIDVDKQALSKKSDYFEKLVQDKKEIDVSQQLDEHILRTIMIIYSDTKNVVKSLHTAVKLLIVGDEIHSKEITQASLDYIRQMDRREFKKFKEDSENNPLMLRLISNVEKILDQYPSLRLEEVLAQVSMHYLYGDINDHIKNMIKAGQKLEEITQLTWKFNGVGYYKSDSCYDGHSYASKYPTIYSNVATSILISRGILSEQLGGVKSSFSKDHYRWNCQLNNEAELLKMDAKQLRNDIEEASDLIANITKKSCHFLHIYPVKNARYYEVLEKIGCIKVKEYMAFNAQAIDFDLHKLRKLKDEYISMDEIWKRYKNADPSKPLFEQILEENTLYRLFQLFKPSYAEKNQSFWLAPESFWLAPDCINLDIRPKGSQ